LVIAEFVVLPDELITLRSCISDRSFHVTGKALTVFRPNKVDIVFIRIKGIDAVTQLDEPRKRSRTAVRLKARFDVWVVHKGGVVEEALRKVLFSGGFVNAEDFADRFNEILFFGFAFVFLGFEFRFPLNKLFAAVEENEDAALQIAR
jgi:hypothetical protein